MLGLKGLVNKLGEHFFKEYKGNKQSDLDIYGFLKKIYGKDIKLSNEKTSCDCNDLPLGCEEKNYIIDSGKGKITVSYIVHDINMRELSMDDLLESDELNDSDDVVRIIIVKGEDNGHIMTSRFELDNDGYKYSCNNVGDMC